MNTQQRTIKIKKKRKKKKEKKPKGKVVKLEKKSDPWQKE